MTFFPPRGYRITALKGFLSEGSHGSLRTRLVKGSVWSLAGSAGAQLLGVVASILTARILGKEHFGEFGVIQSTVAVFGTFAGVGLGLTSAKYVAEWKTNQPVRAGQIINLSLFAACICSSVISIALFWSAPILASKWLNAPFLSFQLRLGCILLFLNAVGGAQTGALSGFESFLSIARAALIRGLVSLPLSIAGAYLWGLTGAVIGLIAATLTGMVLSHTYLVRVCNAANVPLGLNSGVIKEWRILWHYSLPAFLCSALASPVSWALNAMLVNQPHGYAEMGVFSAASQWRTAFMFVPGVIGQVVMPLVSSLHRSDARRVRRVLLAAMLITAAVALPLLVGIMVFSPQIMGLYGRGFAGHGDVLAITSITAALAAIQTPIGNVISGLGRMWLAALMNTGHALVLLLSAWLLLRHNSGALALAQGYLIAYSVHTIWTFWFASTVISTKEKLL